MLLFSLEYMLILCSYFTHFAFPTSALTPSSCSWDDSTAGDWHLTLRSSRTKLFEGFQIKLPRQKQKEARFSDVNRKILTGNQLGTHANVPVYKGQNTNWSSMPLSSIQYSFPYIIHHNPPSAMVLMRNDRNEKTTQQRRNRTIHLLSPLTHSPTTVQTARKAPRPNDSPCIANISSQANHMHSWYS